MMKLKNLFSRLSLVFAVTLFACSGGDDRTQEPEGRLLPGDEAYDPTAEERRLREMQYIKVVTDDGRTGYWSYDPIGVDGALMSVILNYDMELEADPDGCFWKSGCEREICIAAYAARGGDRFTTIAKGFAFPIPKVLATPDEPEPFLWIDENFVWQSNPEDPIIDEDRNSLVLPSQNTAARGMFANWAVEIYALAMSQALDAFDLSCTAEQQSRLATIYTESLTAQRAAAELGMEKILAVADSQLGSSPDSSVAARRSQAGKELSRASAVHRLVGGEAGVVGSSIVPLCEPKAQSRSVEMAINVIRDLAPQPGALLEVASDLDVGDESSLAQFLNGTLAPGGSASLRERLQAHRGEPTSDVAEYFGVRNSDFAKAVQYIADEISAFNRAAVPLSDGSSGAYQRFATTALPPSDPPDVYWVALARTDSSLDDSASSSLSSRKYCSTCAPGNRFQSEGWNLTINETLGETSTRGSNSFLTALWEAKLAVMNADPAKNGASGVLSAALGQAKSLGFLHHHIEVAQDRFRLDLLNSDDKDYYLAVGDRTMRCAIQGSVEGEDTCDVHSQYSHLGISGNLGKTLVPFAAATPVTAGFSRSVTAAPVRAGSRRVYVLRVREDWVATAEEPTPGRGDFLGVTGMAPHRPYDYAATGFTPEVHSVGVVPYLEAQAADIFKVSPENCDKNELICAGNYFDERLPLENELSEDGDGVESSWRYYLSRARDAADKSDALAAEFIEKNLATDVRDEELELRQAAQREKAAQSLEQLQSICGTSVELDVLLNALGRECGSSEETCEEGEIVYSNADSGSCTTATVLNDGHVCINNKIVLRWENLLAKSKNPELKKLQECIRDFDDTEEPMHMAKSSLCYWEDVGPCRGTAPEGAPSRCPIVKTGECPPAMDHELSVTQSFGWFDVSSQIPPPPNDELCGYVRKARGYLEDNNGSLENREMVKETISKSRVYSQSRLNELRGLLKVEAKYGDYVTVSHGGRLWLTTGDARGGAFDEGWPCRNGGLAPSVPEDCSTHPSSGGTNDGLFCEHANCANVAERRQLNDRLLDAAIALELMSQPHLNVDNPGDTSYVEFWLPVLLARGLNPKGYVTRPFTLASGSVINERANRKWKVYSYNDVPSDGVAFVRNGESLGITGEYDGLLYNFAIGRRLTGADQVAATTGAFFGGLRNERHDVFGYFENRLLERTSHSNAMRTAEDWVYSVESPVSLVWPIQVKNFDGETISLNEGEWRSDYTRQVSVFPSYGYSGSSLCDDDWLDLDPLFTDDTAQKALEDLQDELKKRDLGLDYNNTVDSTTGDQGEICDSEAIVPVGEAVNLAEDEMAVLDAFEMICEAAHFSGGKMNCGELPDIASMDDLGSVASYLDCKADQISHAATTTILERVPSAVREGVVAAEGPDSVRGEMGQAISTLRASLRAMADSGEEFRRIFRGFAVEMRQIDSRVKIEELEDTLTQLRFVSSLANNVAQCAEAVSKASSWGKTIINNGSDAAAAGVVCGNSVVQTVISGSIKNAEQEINEEQRKIIFGDAETEFLRLEKAISDETARVNGELEQIQRALGTIEDLRQQARRSVDQAIWHLSYQTKKAETISNVLSAQAIAAQERYTRAHENAQKWAFLARRAVEQRLGVDLSQIYEELPLVEAPYQWANSVCATSAVNYENLQNGDGQFADAFIGEYVTKLENVVESYRLQFGFQDGADVVVASLRDDILNVRADCEVPSKNLLYYSSDLAEAVLTAATPVGLWGIEGCPLPEDGNGLGSDNPCLSVAPSESPFQAPGSPQERVPGFEIRFGDGESGDCESSGSGGAPGFDCAWTSSSRLVQAVALTKGETYRFSWYAPPNSTGAMGPGKYAGAVWGPSGNEVGSRLSGVADEQGVIVEGEVLTWNRHYREFTAGAEGTYLIGFGRPDDLEVPGWNGLWTVSVAAPMLEVINSASNADTGPSAYSNTEETLTEIRPECEDSEGVEFRERWSDKRCERVCPGGTGASCEKDAIEQCYRELSLYIDQRSIEKGTSFIQSGFARGNFNYRIQSVGLNFVGTGLRNCEESNLPSTCYAGSFVPFSLYHLGPYYVRNHYGDDFEAHLFEGVIEHARGLAAERYLSNPISSTDKELLADFTRLEYQGRPLDGRFTIRLWEEPGVDFAQLEDVQIVLNYSYWSR